MQFLKIKPFTLPLLRYIGKGYSNKHGNKGTISVIIIIDMCMMFNLADIFKLFRSFLSCSNEQQSILANGITILTYLIKTISRRFKDQYLWRKFLNLYEYGIIKNIFSLGTKKKLLQHQFFAFFKTINYGIKILFEALT